MTAAARQRGLDEHLEDLSALLSHFIAVIEGQLDVSLRGKFSSLQLNQKLFTVLIRHKNVVEQQYNLHIRRTPDGESKETLTTWLNTAAGLYNRFKDYPESRAVRDNFTALGLLISTLTRLKTFGLMNDEEKISNMAHDMLREVCPLIIEFNHRMPEIIARETAQREGLVYQQSVADRVARAVKNCWKLQA